MNHKSKADEGWTQETNPDDQRLEKERGMHLECLRWGGEEQETHEYVSGEIINEQNQDKT